MIQEERWINYITQHYTIDMGMSPCVFRVPEGGKVTSLESYTPQVMGLGPYHHMSPDVQQMENQKRTAIKDYLATTELQRIVKLVKELPEKYESKAEGGEPENPQRFVSLIRCCYDKYLDYENRTLVWIVTIDSTYLLHFLKNYDPATDDPFKKEAIKDVMMLENQIPFVILSEVQKAIHEPIQKGTLLDFQKAINRFCNAESPFKLKKDEYPDESGFALRDGFHQHLLHYLFDWTMNSRHDGRRSMGAILGLYLKDRIERAICYNPFFMFVRRFWRACVETTDGVGQVMGTLTNSIEQAASAGVKLSIEISKTKDVLKQIDRASSSNRKNHNSMNASATQLYGSGKVSFIPILGSPNKLQLVEENDPYELRLPVITLRHSTEVILRNMIAYEAATTNPNSARPLADYVNLMCELIETEDDVRLLRRKEIIRGDLDNKQIVSIFNGIYISPRGPVNHESTATKIVAKVSRRARLGTEGIKKFFAFVQITIQKIFPFAVLVLLSLQYYCTIHQCGSRRSMVYQALLPDGFSENDLSMMPRKMMLGRNS